MRQTMAAMQAAYDSRSEILRQNIIDLERSYDITLEALGDALDLKDAETEGHSKRVTAFTMPLPGPWNCRTTTFASWPEEPFFMMSAKWQFRTPSCVNPAG